MYEDIIEFCINYAQKKVDFVEARMEINKGESFILKNGVSDASAFATSRGIGLRFIDNKSLGFVAINDFNKEKIKALIDKGIKVTKGVSKIKKEINFSDEKANEDSYAVKQKKNFFDVSTEEKIDALLEIDKNLKDVANRYFSMSVGESEKHILNSEGTRIKSIIPRISFVYFLTLMANNKSMQRYWHYGACGGWEFFEKWKLRETIRKEIDGIKNVLGKGNKVKPGKMDLVVDPEVTGIMTHESVGHPYEADRILGRESAQAGESFVTKEMLNTKIGSDVVTVVDDPTIPNSYGFYLYDDEGVKARKRVLMKNGMINEFLHNRDTAFDMGLKSNGSARAAVYNVENIVRMANTFVEKGDQTREELIKDVKKGILMKNFMEWNIDDVRLSQKYTGSEAYFIKNGEIKGPVFEPILEITTPVLWKSVDGVGKNFEFHAATCGKGEPIQGIPVFHGGPSLRLRNVMIK